MKNPSPQIRILGNIYLKWCNIGSDRNCFSKISSIVLGAEYLSYMISIAFYAVKFFGNIISVLARVKTARIGCNFIPDPQTIWRIFAFFSDALYCKPGQVQVFGVARDETARIGCEVIANPQSFVFLNGDSTLPERLWTCPTTASGLLIAGKI